MQSFQAPLCKGSCRRKPTEGLFFYNPSTTSWSPSPYTGEANSEPVSATPARALRALANPCADGTKKENRGDFSSLFFYQFAALPHLFSSLLSLISAQRSVPRQSIMQISPPLPSFTILPSVSESFALASSGICESFVCSPSFTSS